MAGRGCTIQLHLLNDDFSNEDMSLPVALHSPLEVLKQQLVEISGIQYDDQVLILCDLTDPERNRDVLLLGRDHMSLRDCGIRNDSLITLHRLGMPSESVQKFLSVKCSSTKKSGVDESNTFTLHTPITAAEANHSYNGVIFDVEAKGPYERVFARDRPWEANKTTNQSAHWWAHRESISRVGWEQVAEQVCRPSWDKPFEIKFDIPVVLLPHGRRGLYVHSGLPDDLGIQYQSYGQSDIVGEDEHVIILPGVGHTGHQPFDEQHGWYRSFRGLSGSLTYSRRAKGWHPHCHHQFPRQLRESVRQVLLCHLKAHLDRDRDGGDQIVNVVPKTFADTPLFVVYYLMEFMHWDWFADVDLFHYLGPEDRSSPSTSPTSSARDAGAVQEFLQYLYSGQLSVAEDDDDEDEDYEDEQYEEEEEGVDADCGMVEGDGGETDVIGVEIGVGGSDCGSSDDDGSDDSEDDDDDDEESSEEDMEVEDLD